jgi:hypothetical protein
MPAASLCLSMSFLHTRRCPTGGVRQSEIIVPVDCGRYPHFHFDRSVKLGESSLVN